MTGGEVVTLEQFVTMLATPALGAVLGPGDPELPRLGWELQSIVG